MYYSIGRYSGVAEVGGGGGGGGGGINDFMDMNFISLQNRSPRVLDSIEELYCD